MITLVAAFIDIVLMSAGMVSVSLLFLFISAAQVFVWNPVVGENS